MQPSQSCDGLYTSTAHTHTILDLDRSGHRTETEVLCRRKGGFSSAPPLIRSIFGAFAPPRKGLSLFCCMIDGVHGSGP